MRVPRFFLSLAVALAAALLTNGPLPAADLPALFNPIEIGRFELVPGGFISSVTAIRSNGGRDGISTKFGQVPITDAPTTALNSFRHSRVQAKGGLHLGPGRLSGYVESDFLNPPTQQPFRFRLYYATYSLGNWDFSAGEHWSLLHPHREGMTSDVGVMQPRGSDPGFDAGLMGIRNRQVRVTRHFGEWHAALAVEEGRDLVLKVARDAKRLHWEVVGLAGRSGHYGATAAAVVHLTPRIDWVTEQGWVRGGGRQSFNAVPASVPTTSTLQGIEAKIGGKWMAFAYGGLVYGTWSSGNRLVREWTVGGSREIGRNRLGKVVADAQYSQLHRALWSGPAGTSQLAMVYVRQYFGGAR